MKLFRELFTSFGLLPVGKIGNFQTDFIIGHSWLDIEYSFRIAANSFQITEKK